MNSFINRKPANSNTTLTGRLVYGVCYAVNVSGTVVYFGNDQSLEIADISDPGHPIVLGKIILPSIVNGITVANNYVYVADGGDGLRIIDVSNPSGPVEVGFYDTDGEARSTAVNGNYAYVADWDEGLRIIDVTNPVNPVEMGFYDTDVHAWSVAVSGNYAYVADGKDGIYIIRNDLIAGINEETTFPTSFALYQNYPNPFNSTTTLHYKLPTDSDVRIVVFDMMGRKVVELENRQLPKGDYHIVWDGKTTQGNEVPSGIYFSRIVAGDYTKTIKMVLIK